MICPKRAVSDDNYHDGHDGDDGRSSGGGGGLRLFRRDGKISMALAPSARLY